MDRLGDWWSKQTETFNAAREPPARQGRRKKRHHHDQRERNHLGSNELRSPDPSSRSSRDRVRFTDESADRERPSSTDSASISPGSKPRKRSPTPEAATRYEQQPTKRSGRLSWNKQLEQVMASIPIDCGITYQQYSDLDKSLYDYERDQPSAAERASRKRRDSTHVVTLTLKGDGSLETRMTDRHIVPRKTPRHEYVRRQTKLHDGAGSMSSGSSVASSVFSDDQVRYVVRRHHQRVHQHKFFSPNDRRGEGAGKFVKLEAGLKKVEGGRDLIASAREPYVEVTQGRAL